MLLAQATAFWALLETAEETVEAAEETAFWALASAWAIWGEAKGEAPVDPPVRAESGSEPPPRREEGEEELLRPSCSARTLGKPVWAPLGVVVGRALGAVMDAGRPVPTGFVSVVRRAAAESAGLGIRDHDARRGAI